MTKHIKSKADVSITEQKYRAVFPITSKKHLLIYSYKKRNVLKVDMREFFYTTLDNETGGEAYTASRWGLPIVATDLPKLVFCLEKVMTELGFAKITECDELIDPTQLQLFLRNDDGDAAEL